jgi:hypothetical protein
MSVMSQGGTVEDDGVEIEAFECPWGCGYRADHVGLIAEKSVKPDPGDVGMCMRCGEPHLFTETTPRKPTLEELTGIFSDPRFRLLREAHRRMRREN